MARPYQQSRHASTDRLAYRRLIDHLTFIRIVFLDKYANSAIRPAGPAMEKDKPLRWIASSKAGQEPNHEPKD
jgi:hypothetical protein